MPAANTARIVASLAAVALLSACATGPKVSSQVESQRYRSHAARTYAAPGPASDPWGPHIKEASAKYDVPEKWIREVMRQESGGRLYGRGGGLITSSAGAMGLMQVMPGTYDELRGRYSELGDDPFDPRNNIMAGTAYIREMYDIYGAPGFLAAYNAGPGRLDDYLTRNRTLPEETRRYVAAIGPRLGGAEPNRASPGAQYAMNALPVRIPGGSRYASNQRYSAPRAPITLSPQPAWSAPVQLAQAPARAAPASGNRIVLAPQPAWTPPQPVLVADAGASNRIVLTPQPAWTPPEDAAALADGGNFIRLDPRPVEIAQAPEPLQLEPARTPWRAEPPRVEVAALPQPPARSVLREPRFAQLPEPPRAPFREPGRNQTQLAAAALVPVGPRGFSLVSPANAQPIRPRDRAAAGGNWSVQVGAFANEGLASAATSAARDHAREALAPARSSVTPVRQSRGTLYRARLNGLSRDGAAQACERLARARTTCVVVSPDAQS